MYHKLFVSLSIFTAAFAVTASAEAAAGRNIAYFFREYQPQHAAPSEETAVIMPIEEFDLTGPGSEPLSESLENRIARYLLSDRCRIGRTIVIQQRCTYLLQLQSYQEGHMRIGRLSPRTNTVIEQVRQGASIRRSVGSKDLRAMGNANSFLRVRVEKGGFRARPRTLNDVRALRDEVQRAHAVRRSTRESSVPLPIEEDLEAGNE